MILKKLVVGPFATNCYIAGSESTKQGMIIDPGGEAGAILKSVGDTGLDIRFIVLTHGHLDHICGLKAVKEATGADLAIHTEDARYLNERPMRGAVIGIDYPDCPHAERLLNDGDSLDFADMHFLVLHTPGHSPGSICLSGHGILFSGDTLFNYGIGRTDLQGGSYSRIMNSIHSRLMALPDDTAVYPGHGPETTIGAERRGNPFLRR